MDSGKLFGIDWAEKLASILKSDMFKEIGRELKKQQSEGKLITPLFDDMFRAFQLCRWSDLHTVILTTNALSHMDGLAFSTQYEFLTDCPPVIEKFMDAIEQDVCDGLYLKRQMNMKYLAKQGFLMLNCDLSSLKAHPGVHISLWRPFIVRVIQIIADLNRGLNFVLIGKEAHKYKELPMLAPKLHDVYTMEHPQLAVMQKRAWKHCHIFDTLNRGIKFIHDKQIIWTP